MLILNLTTEKHSQYIPISAYHLNSDDSKNWKLLTNISVITQNNRKLKTETTLSLESHDVIH